MTDAETDALSLAYLQHKPEAAARTLESFSAEQLREFLQAVPPAVLAPVIAHMSAWPAARSLAALPPRLAANLLRLLPDSDAETLLRLTGSDTARAILAQMPSAQTRKFQRKLAYPTSAVGAWMDSSIPSFTSDTAAGSCLEHIRQARTPLGGVVMVIDNGRRFCGLVEIETLLTADARQSLSRLMTSGIVPLSARATLWEVENHDGWIQFPTLPVVDLDGHLLGALTHSALRTGTARQARHHTLPRFSLPAHMTRAFFIALGGMSRLLTGLEHRSDASLRSGFGEPQPDREDSRHE